MEKTNQKNLKAHLYLTDDNSDKEYVVEVTGNDDIWSVKTQHGRRGSVLKITSKLLDVSWGLARSEFEKIVAGQKKKGYTADPSGVTGFGPFRRHPNIMRDPAEHDFRSPDLAWVRGDKEVLRELDFSCFSSYVKIGSIKEMQRFAIGAAIDYEKLANELIAKDPTLDDGAAVLYWENIEIDHAMVCEVHFSDTYCNLRNSHSSFPHCAGPQEKMNWCCGDLSAVMLVETALDAPGLSSSQVKDALSFIKSITTPTFKQDVLEAIEEGSDQASVPGTTRKHKV